MTRYEPGRFFSDRLDVSDPAVAAILAAEWRRQCEGIELIASENHVSRATLDALASPIVNKTVEGYPGNRYYGGAAHADDIERLAIERACALFGAAYANVQPHSGSQANLAVFRAFLEPGDTILSMELSAGGHLSHGSPVNVSGRWMRPVHYGVRPDDGLIDHDQVRALAREHRPRLVIAGGSAYPRVIDFEFFAEVAAEVDARLLVDMAHFAGLVVGGVHPDPVPHADVVTTTTYKNLRGVRGGVVLSRDALLGRRLDTAVFPGVQGSVMLNAVAAKAVCFAEAATPEFTTYAAQVLTNARALADSLMDAGVRVVTGGTDTPIVLVDLRDRAFTGRDAQNRLEAVGLTVNKNGVPGDERKPTETSGIRLGTSAGTARGLGADEFASIGRWIAEILDAVSANTVSANTVSANTVSANTVSANTAVMAPRAGSVDERVARQVADLAAGYPMEGVVSR